MGQWSFGYDQLNRLVTAQNGDAYLPGTPDPPAHTWAADFCWAYDSFGNRLQLSTSDAAFNWSDGTCAFNGTNVTSVLASYNAQNRMTSTNAPGFTFSPSYDAAGDVTNDGRNVYVYDAEGRVCAVGLAGYSGGTGYLYDAAGNRVAKGSITTLTCDVTSNGFTQTEGYVVGPSGEQLTEVGASTSTWNHTNIYAGGKLIGTYDQAGLHFHIDDPLGTRRAQVSSSGALEATYQSLQHHFPQKKWHPQMSSQLAAMAKMLQNPRKCAKTGTKTQETPKKPVETQ